MDDFLNAIHAILFVIIIFLFIVILFGAPVMWLWNALMPVIFGLGRISFWQAVGLSLLCTMLFGKVNIGNSK